MMTEGKGARSQQRKATSPSASRFGAGLTEAVSPRSKVSLNVTSDNVTQVTIEKQMFKPKKDLDKLMETKGSYKSARDRVRNSGSRRERAAAGDRNTQDLLRNIYLRNSDVDNGG